MYFVFRLSFVFIFFKIIVGRLEGKIDALIQGSTLGLSSHQILKKHKFLKPGWLQPVELDTQINSLVSTPSQSAHASTNRKISDCDTKTRNNELYGPQQPKRYKFDIQSMNPFSRFQSTKAVPQNSKQDDRTEPMNRSFKSIRNDRMSSNDRNFSLTGLNSTTNQIKSYHNISVSNGDADLETLQGAGGKGIIVDETRNNIWENKHYASNRHSTPSILFTNKVGENNVFQDPHVKTVKHRKTNSSSKYYPETYKGKSSQTNHAIKTTSQFNSDDASAMNRLSNSWDSSQSDTVVRFESMKQNSHRRHDMYTDNKRPNSWTDKLASEHGLMRVSPNHLFTERNDEHAITVHAYSKQIEKHISIDNTVETVSNNKTLLSISEDTTHKDDVVDADLPYGFPWQTESQLDQVHDGGYKTSTKLCKSISMTSYETCYPDVSKKKDWPPSLEKEALDVSSYVKYKETEFESTVWLQGVTYDREKKLAKIDQIFEAFVPAMRTTDISEGFVSKLIGLHKRKTEVEKYSSNCSLKNHLLRSTIIEENEDFDGVDIRLSIQELLSHFSSLEESFVSFAKANDVFKKLCQKDQTELLTRNSILFVQVS